MLTLKIKIIFVLLGASIALVVTLVVFLLRVYVWDLDMLSLNLNPDMEVAWCGVSDDDYYLNDMLITETGKALNQTGKELFLNNCSACHAVNAVLVGPALGSIAERRDRKWIYSFVQNSQRIIASGDTAAVKVFNDFNKQQMPTFGFMESEIDSIIVYLEQLNKF